MPGVGMWEMLLLGLVVLLVFGPKRLPEMGRSLGRGMREFKNSVSGNGKDDELEGLSGDPLVAQPIAVVTDTTEARPVHSRRLDEREIA
jgi:sec-independent protein translocase protein TatA